MSDQISRRSLAKGTAWTVPAITVAAAAPASATSPGCGAEPVLDINWRLYFNWGNPGTESEQTSQRFEFSELQFSVFNLPPGVQVLKVEWGMWLTLRFKGNQYPYRNSWRNLGIPYPEYKSSPTYSAAPTIAQRPSCWNDGKCGWSPLTWGGVTVSNNVVTGGTMRWFEDDKLGKSQRPAWQLRETWTNTGANFTATNKVTPQNPTGCGSFITGRMGISNQNRTEKTGTTGLDSHWFAMTASQTCWADFTNNATPDTYHDTVHGAIAYLDNGKTVQMDNSPAGMGNPNSWL